MKNLIIFFFLTLVVFDANTQTTDANAQTTKAWRLLMPKSINLSIEGGHWGGIIKNLNEFNQYYRSRGISYAYAPPIAPNISFWYGINSTYTLT